MILLSKEAKPGQGGERSVSFKCLASQINAAPERVYLGLDWMGWKGTNTTLYYPATKEVKRSDSS